VNGVADATDSCACIEGFSGPTCEGIVSTTVIATWEYVPSPTETVGDYELDLAAALDDAGYDGQYDIEIVELEDGSWDIQLDFFNLEGEDVVSEAAVYDAVRSANYDGTIVEGSDGYSGTASNITPNSVLFAVSTTVVVFATSNY
jgi:hypothetical protein